MRFTIYNECGSLNEAFLADWLPRVGGVMARRLGISPPEHVHVILSSHEEHNRRFPPRADELRGLVDTSEFAELAEHPDTLADQYPRVTYALGVATLIDPRQAPPPSAPTGEPAIYLDSETITALSSEDELDVVPEAIFGLVAAHELAHILRRHNHGRPTPVHGWLAEGDAQRDAWNALTELYGEPRRLARLARTAQVRLADRQPAAYWHFDATAAERGAARQQPLEPPAIWLISPAREVFILVRDELIEVPVICNPNLRAPTWLDTVYLAERSMRAGPWYVSAIAEEPRVGHPRDIAAVRHERVSARQPVLWLQLRPYGKLVVGGRGKNARWPVRADLCSEDEREELFGLTDDALTWSERIAAERRQKFRETLERHFKRPGKPLPAGAVKAIEEDDPYDDWRS